MDDSVENKRILYRSMKLEDNSPLISSKSIVFRILPLKRSKESLGCGMGIRAFKKPLSSHRRSKEEFEGKSPLCGVR